MESKKSFLLFRDWSWCNKVPFGVFGFPFLVKNPFLFLIEDFTAIFVFLLVKFSDSYIFYEFLFLNECFLYYSLSRLLKHARIWFFVEDRNGN